MGATGRMPTEMTDDELVAAVRARDDAAFEELYRRYGRKVGGYAYRLVGDFGRAEEVTQETFLSALMRLRGSSAAVDFKPWLFVIARNEAIDILRRSSRMQELSISGEELRPGDGLRLVASGAPDTAVLAKERLAELKEILLTLSAHQHRILVLRELEGLSYRDIGSRLNLSQPAVESTLFRARRRLREDREALEARATDGSAAADRRAAPRVA
jgi:RNA polymerase sigma factor (sigma-70 family)